MPPSTQALCVFIQDSVCGSITKLGFNRFKTRQSQESPGDLMNLNKYGPWAHTWGERLTSVLITFSGTTKPQTMIQYQTPVSNLNNTMLQRYLMSLYIGFM